MMIIELDEVDSTNEYCKRNDFSEDFAVIARRQTSGRGTKGRTFVSDDGGLYLSLVRHYANFPASNAFCILVNACVAVCRTLESLSLTPSVRWANDVLVGGKKICGTLIENTFGGGRVVKSIVGIGIDVNNEISEELKDIATSVKDCGVDVSVDEVKLILLKNLNNEYTIEDYKSYIGFLGDIVTVKKSDCEYEATALDVCPDGRLKVRRADGTVEILSSAEVGLRI